MNKSMNSVYLGISLDGYIADKNGELGYLDMVKIPEGEDMGYYAFMERIDALIMGRNTFETLLGFNVPWPYDKPVYVWSSKQVEIPADLGGKAFSLNGSIEEVLDQMHGNGHMRLYIDGGGVVHSFMKEDLVDEWILTTIPIFLGGGISLFRDLPESLELELKSSKVFADQIVQNHYVRKRS